MTPVTDAFLAGCNLDVIAALMSCDVRQAQVVLRSELHRIAADSTQPALPPIEVAVFTSRPTAPIGHRAIKATVKAALDAPAPPKRTYKPRAPKVDEPKTAPEPKVCRVSLEMAMYPEAIREPRAVTRRAIWDALRDGPLELVDLARAARISEGAALITAKAMLKLGLTERTTETPYRWQRKPAVAEPVE